MTSVTPSFTKALLGLLPGLGVTLPQSVVDSVASLSPEQRLPMSVQDMLWQEVQNQSTNPAIGLAIGAALQPAHYDMVGFLLLSSPDLASAVEGLVSYSALIGEGGKFSYSSRQQIRRLSYQAQFQVARQIRIEAILSSVVVGARWLVGERLIPLEVGFEHQLCGDIKAYRQVFGTELILFNQPANYVHLSGQNWYLPLASGSEAVREQMHRLAQQQLKQLQPQSILDKVTALLSRQPSLNRTQLASMLAISERHLNRKLAEQQTSFKMLAEQIRKELAIDMLADNRHTQANIACFLGYSDDSAFAKAFKRWMGMGVKEYRLRQQLNVPPTE
ncbi:AraC family transcriptional regulator ligand-binding domain-containing protein [Neptunicella sp. SCSIO 80796]|uniref:AraC family transcriptional regulator n=1 Tax=Neptunicella plasticusilytica TaxID=3117012 RepID=UPI003A4E4F79